MEFIPWHALLRGALRITSQRLKLFLYEHAAKASVWFGYRPYVNIFRLPFGLVLKATPNPIPNEGKALEFIQSIRGVNAPRLIDYMATSSQSYVLMTWIDGECCTDHMDELKPSDRERLAHQLREQITCMREQTRGDGHAIGNALGGIIFDPRIPWLQDDPRMLSSIREFFEQVWIGLDFPHLSPILKPLIQPLIERENVPVVFCHGDILPKNIIFPGGLDKWRAGETKIALIDWEYAGWMPLHWEALKATWMICDPEEEKEWYEMIKKVFPESLLDLEVDWEWRSKSGIAIV
ncbi:Protein kinase-like domain superfamily protein [Abortiporus biennis]